MGLRKTKIQPIERKLKLVALHLYRRVLNRLLHLLYHFVYIAELSRPVVRGQSILRIFDQQVCNGTSYSYRVIPS